MRRWGAICALVALAAAQLMLFLRLRSTATDYDEGVYLLSLRALRAGETLGSDVFAAQPPGFYALLRTVGSAFGAGVTDVRWGIALVSIAGVVGAWSFARPLVGDLWALLPAALPTIAPPVPLYGVRVLADLPSLWLAVGGFGLAATATTRAGSWWPAVAGATLGAAVSVKLAAAMALPFAAVVLWERRRLLAAAGGAALVWATFLLLHAGALAELWESVIVYHRKARSTPAVVDRSDQLSDLVHPRVPFTWLAAAGLALLVLRLVLRRANRLEVSAWGWAAASALFLLTHEPLHPNHLVWLPVPLAVAAGTTLAAEGSRVGRNELAAAVLVLALAAGYVQQQRRITEDDVPQPASEVALARLIEERTRPGDLVATDVPGAAVLAGRNVPPELVDTARLRFQTGTLDVDETLDILDRDCVQAVVAGRSFLDQPGLVPGIRARFGRRTIVPADPPDADAALYERRRGPCRGRGS